MALLSKARRAVVTQEAEVASGSRIMTAGRLLRPVAKLVIQVR